MSKIGTLTLIGAATAAVLCSGAGVAAAADTSASATPVVAPGEPDPSGTGSSTTALTDLIQSLVSGSAQATAPAE